MHSLKHNKILAYEDLTKEVKQIHDMRGFGICPPLALTNGCFDLFQAGHARLLNSIKSSIIGGKLIVGINSDESVRANKGSDRPIICEDQRAYLVACHESVDNVFIFNEPTVERDLRRLKPAFWYKGGDYDISNLKLEEKNASQNTEILFVPFLEGVSATNIISNIKNK